MSGTLDDPDAVEQDEETQQQQTTADDGGDEGGGEGTPWSGAPANQQGGIPVANYGSSAVPAGGVPAPARAPVDAVPLMRAAGIPEKFMPRIESMIAEGRRLKAARTPPPSAAPAGPTKYNLDDYEIDTSSPAISLAPEEEKPKETKGALRRFGEHIWASTMQQTAESIAAVEGAAQQVESMPKLAEWVKGTRQWFEQQAKETIDGMSPEQRQGFTASLWGGDPGSVLENPGAYLSSSVASMVPAGLLMLLGRAKIFTMPVMMLFGAQNAGHSYLEFVKKIEEAKPEQLMENDYYKELRAKDVSDEEARKQLINHIAPYMMFAQGVLGATGAVPGLRAAMGKLGGAAGAGFAKRFGLGFLEGGAGMGLVGAGSDLTQQAANVAAGVQRPEIDWGQTARTAGAWALPGAITTGGLHGAFGKRPVKAGDPPVVDPAILAAGEELPSNKVEAKPGEQGTLPPEGGEGQPRPPVEEPPPPPAPEGGIRPPGQGEPQLSQPAAGPPPPPAAGAAPPPGGQPPAGPQAAPPTGGPTAGIAPPGTAVPPIPVETTPATSTASTASTATPTAAAAGEAAAPPKAPVIEEGPLKPLNKLTKPEAIAELGLSKRKGETIKIAELRRMVGEKRDAKPAAAPIPVKTAEPAPAAAPASGAPRSPHQVQVQEGVGHNEAYRRAVAEGWIPPESTEAAPRPAAEDATRQQPGDPDVPAEPGIYTHGNLPPAEIERRRAARVAKDEAAAAAQAAEPAPAPEAKAPEPPPTVVEPKAAEPVPAPEARSAEPAAPPSVKDSAGAEIKVGDKVRSTSTESGNVNDWTVSAINHTPDGPRVVVSDGTRTTNFSSKQIAESGNRLLVTPPPPAKPPPAGAKRPGSMADIAEAMTKRKPGRPKKAAAEPPPPPEKPPAASEGMAWREVRGDEVVGPERKTWTSQDGKRKLVEFKPNTKTTKLDADGVLVTAKKKAAPKAEAEPKVEPEPEPAKAEPEERVVKVDEETGITSDAEVVRAKPKAEDEPAKAEAEPAKAEAEAETVALKRTEDTTEAPPANKGEELKDAASIARAKRLANKAALKAKEGVKVEPTGKAYVAEEAKPDTRTPEQVREDAAREKKEADDRAAAEEENLKKEKAADRAEAAEKKRQRDYETARETGVSEKATARDTGKAEDVDAATGGELSRTDVADAVAHEDVNTRNEIGVETTKKHEPTAEEEGAKEGKKAEDADQPSEEITGVDDNDVFVHEDDDPGATTSADGGKNYKPTTDKRLIANRLVRDIINGEKTVEDAAHIYGEHKEGTKKWRWANFGEFLKAALKDATDPAHGERLKELAQEEAELKAARGKRDMTRGETAERSKRNKAITEEGKRLVDQMNSIEHLEKMLDEFEGRDSDTVFHEDASQAIDEAITRKMEEEGLPAPKVDAGMDIANAIVKAVRASSVNAELKKIMADAEGNGGAARLHDLLDALVNAKLPKELGYFQELARAMRQVTPNIEVVSADKMLSDPKTYGRVPLNSRKAGAFLRTKDGNAGYILLNHIVNDRYFSPIETVLHEASHSLTSNYIEGLHPSSRDFQLLEAILLETSKRNLFDSQTAHARSLGEPGGDANYAVTSLKELHSVIMTSPAMQAWMRSTTPSAKFTQTMAKLGYPVGKQPGGVWKAFTGMVRRILGRPGKDVPASFLDHVLAPLSDIAQRGAELERFRPTAEQARRGEATVAHFSEARDTAAEGNRFRNKVATTLNKFDPKGKSDAATQLWLQGSTLDGIVGWNRKLVNETREKARKTIDKASGKVVDVLKHIVGNPMENYRRSMEDAAYGDKKFKDQYAEQVRDLLPRLAPERYGDGAALERDVGIANARLGPNSDNSHLKGPDADRAKALQERFNKLTPEQKSTYIEHRELRRKWYEQDRDARLHDILSKFVPDMTEAQRDSLAEAMRTKKGIEAVIAGSSPVGTKLGKVWKNNEGMIKAVAKVHRMGHVTGDYFPLRRSGDYVVRYGTKGDKENYGVEMFETRAEAEARRQELIKEKPNEEVTEVMLKRESDLDEISPASPMLEQFTAAIKSRPDLKRHADAITDQLKDILLESASAGERSRTRLRREKVLGADIDPSRHLSEDYLSQGARIGNARAATARRNALSDLKDLIRYSSVNGKPGDSITLQRVLNELEKRTAVEEQKNDPFSRAARVATQLTFAKSLLSMSQAPLNMADIMANAVSNLGARHKYGAASAALTKALTQLAPSMVAKGVKGSLSNLSGLSKSMKAADWNLSRMAQERFIKGGAKPEHMNPLYEEGRRTGLLDHSDETDIRRLSKGVTGGTASKVFQKFQQLITYGTHALDEMNKSAVLKAAFDLEMRRTDNNVQKSIEHAIETLRNSTPNRSHFSKARIATQQGSLKGLGPPAMQFRGYGLFMHSMMATRAKEMFHGATKEERREAARAFAGIIGTHTLMAGTLGTAGIAGLIRYGGGLYDWVTGAEKPHDYTNNWRRFLYDQLGPTAGEIAANGLPSLIGWDVHRRIGTADLLQVPPMKDFTTASMMQAAATALLGASGENAMNAVGGVFKLAQGDVGGFKPFLPRPIAEAGKAYLLATKGVTDNHGQTILPPEKLSAWNIASQAVGFQPSPVSEVRAGRRAILEAKTEAAAAKRKAIKAWTDATAEGDREGAREAVRTYNEKNKRSPITVGQLLQARKREADLKRHPERLGLSLPRRTAADLVKEGRFANY